MVGDDGVPAPLVPADADLRDFSFMPMDIIRLFGSRFHAIASDAEWRAGVTLWLKSFHQVPAASLPSDDMELCRLAELGRDMKAWRKIKDVALHGFVLCTDGRWYHPIVAEKANEAWQRKQAQRVRSAKGNAARWGARDHHKDESAGGQGSQKEQQDHLDDVQEASLKDQSGSPLRIARDRDRDRDKEIQERAPSTGGSHASRPRALVGPQNPDPAAVAASAVCDAVQGLGFEVSSGDVRLLALLRQGASDAEVVGVAREAAAKGKGWAWVLAAVEGRRQDAAAVVLQAVPTVPWHETRSGIEGKGVEVGVGRWDESAEHWPVYLARVRQAAGVDVGG